MMPVVAPIVMTPVVPVMIVKLTLSIVIANGDDRPVIGEQCPEMTAVTGGRSIRGRCGKRSKAGAKGSDQNFHVSLLDVFNVYRTTCENRQRFRTDVWMGLWSMDWPVTRAHLCREGPRGAHSLTSTNVT